MDYNHILSNLTSLTTHTNNTFTKLTNINKNSLTIHPKSLSHSQNKKTLKTQSQVNPKKSPKLEYPIGTQISL